MKKNRIEKTRYSRQASNGSKQMSFLSEPDFNPILPPKNTKTDEALQIFLKGEKITSLDFQDETSSQRLPAYVNNLIKLGWPVKSDDVLVFLEKRPNKRIFSQYYLEKNIIRKFKKYSGDAR
jgi:hypothetical protein